jgi:hypothetical protein
MLGIETTREEILGALSELDCALLQVLPSDDQIIVGHMRNAAETLRKLKERT